MIEQLPHSYESECAVLGTILWKPELLHEAMSFVSVDDFYKHRHKVIYKVMCDMSRKQELPSTLNVAEILRDSGRDDDAGGIEYLSVLEEHGFAPSELPMHCRKVRKLTIKRKLMDKMERLLYRANNVTEDTSDLLDEAQGTMFQLMGEMEESQSDSDVYTPQRLAELGFANAKRLFDDPEGNKGYQTGFPQTDKILRRLKDVNIIAASTGVGKTGLAMNWAINNGIVAKVPVLYINLEMNIDEITTRILSILSGVEMDCIDTGIYKQPEDFKLVAKFAEKLESSCLYMTDNKPKTINHLVSMIHKNHVKHGIKIVFVDYIGHIRNDKFAYKENSKRISLGRYNQALKQICTSLGIKLVVVAQMNREGEENPSMFNIGECWQLAQDADTFCILHYEWVKNTDHELDPSQEKQFKRYLLTIGKNRNGPAPRTIPLMYNQYTQLMTEEVI